MTVRVWGRFTLVDSRETADIIVVLGSGTTAVVGNVNYPATGNVTALPISRIALIVREAKTGEEVWRDTTGRIGASGRLVNRLRERLEPKRR